MVKFRTQLMTNKIDSSSQDASNVLEHPNFEYLTNEICRLWHEIPVTETINLLEFLHNLNVPMISEANQKLLKNIQINFLELSHDQLVTVENVLNATTESTPLVESILTVLPLMFASRSESSRTQQTTNTDKKSNVPQLICTLERFVDAENDRTATINLTNLLEALNIRIDDLTPHEARDYFLRCVNRRFN